VASMKIIRRHLAREIVGATALVLLAFLGLFAFFDLIYELESIGRNGYQLHHAVLFVALSLPGRVYELIPIAVLIGAMYALTNLARQSEITVMRAAGLSSGSIVMSLVRLGLGFALITFIFGEFVAPPAEKAARQLKLAATSTTVAQEFRSGLWVKDDRYFVNVRTILPDLSLRDIRLYEFDDAMVLRAVSEAKRGQFKAPDTWQLTDVVETRYDATGSRIITRPEMPWRSTLTPEMVSVVMVVPERMSAMSLVSYLRHLMENRQATERFELALWKKLVYPLASIVMLILALPFAYLQDRMGAVSIKVFIGVMIGIGFHMLNGLFSSLGLINNWLPVLSAFAPSVLFLLIASGMLWWVERR
jgi:lipopolysaccharide export system permease protein